MHICKYVCPVGFQLWGGWESQNGKSRLMHLDGLFSVWEDILKSKRIGLELQKIWQTRIEEEHTMQTCNYVCSVGFQLWGGGVGNRKTGKAAQCIRMGY
jgi:hypothetical protein